MYRGVHTVPFDSHSLAPDEVNARAVSMLEEMGVVKAGDKVILTKGDYTSVNAGTNTLKIVEVGAAIR